MQLPFSMTETFLSENLKFSAFFLKLHAYFRTEVQNHCMDGGASICDRSAVTILGTIRISFCTKSKHHPQQTQEAHEDGILDG